MSHAVFAVVDGQPFTQLPQDLFIPPDALEVLLESFTGPLDILWYLIRKQNIDIMNIPMALITQQYMQYIELMEVRRMELAADYLVMAAMLLEIKSKLLLPVPIVDEEEPEEDPRMALVRRLQAYEPFKQAALWVESLPRLERDVFQVQASLVQMTLPKAEPEVSLSSLVAVMEGLMLRQQHVVAHQVTREVLSVRERMTLILHLLRREKSIELMRLVTHHEGRSGLVVALLATLELARQSLVVVTQVAAFTPIYLSVNQEANLGVTHDE